MWTLSREMRFEAAHSLEMHDGDCRRLHGHSWRVRVTIQGFRLHESGPEHGMLMDFSKIGDVMDGIRLQLDHRHLNEALGIYPTSENLAVYIYRRLEESFLFPDKVKLKSVEVWETDGNSCLYELDDKLGVAGM